MAASGLLPKTAHAYRSWRIHEIAPDFELLDVWALPTPGGRDDFPRLVERVTGADWMRSDSLVVRALFEIRWKLGALLGWDDEDDGLGARVRSLRERLPADLREWPPGPEFPVLPFRPLYLLDDEFAAEVANRTVHGLMHLGWVPNGTGGYRGQMAVLVKPNGLLGRAYLAAIKPFRHMVVYPSLLRQLEREWREDAGSASVGAAS